MVRSEIVVFSGLKMASSCCKYVTVSLVPVSALFLAVVFFLGTLSLPILYTELAKKYQYGLVIGADSSNTTLHIYKVEVPVNGIIEEVHYISDQRSLASFEANTSEAGAMVTSLIAQSLNLPQDIRVPKDIVTSTHIYLGATGGMRLLSKKNHDAASEILNATYAAMNNSTYLVHESAKIISGQEEAAGSWATANYLMQSKTGAYGSLVMGESSAEIAFLGTPSKSGQSSFYTHASLYNQSHSIYARSYLCYGHKEARARFLGHLIQNLQQGGNTALSNPCMPINSTLNYTYSEMNDTCVTGPMAEQVFGTSLDLATYEVVFNGTGNVEQCLTEVTKAFNITACQPHLECEGQFVPPPVKGNFIGVSNFKFIAQLFGIDDLVFSRSGRQLLRTFKNNCTHILKEKGMATEKCFYGIFMGHLMEEGFGMTGKAKHDWTVAFQSKELSKSPPFGYFGWTLGYLMNKTTPLVYSGTPYYDSRPYSAVDLVVGMIILTLLCTVFVIFFFLTFYACQKALKAHNGYQSI